MTQAYPLADMDEGAGVSQPVISETIEPYGRLSRNLQKTGYFRGKEVNSVLIAIINKNLLCLLYELKFMKCRVFFVF